MINFTLWLAVILVLLAFVSIVIVVVFGDTETFKAIDKKIARWVKGADDEVLR